MNSIKQKLLKIAKENFNFQQEQIYEEDLVENHLNSISFVRLLFLLEQEFGVEFREEQLDINNYKTFGEIIAHLENTIIH